MRETLEMITASRMQIMVHVLKKNFIFVTNLHLFHFLLNKFFRVIGVERPTVGPLMCSKRGRNECVVPHSMKRSGTPSAKQRPRVRHVGQLITHGKRAPKSSSAVAVSSWPGAASLIQRASRTKRSLGSELSARPKRR